MPLTKPRETFPVSSAVCSAPSKAATARSAKVMDAMRVVLVTSPLAIPVNPLAMAEATTTATAAITAAMTMVMPNRLQSLLRLKTRSI